MTLFFFIVVIFLTLPIRPSIHSSKKPFRLCRLYEDTLGRWVENPKKEPHKDQENTTEVLRHFLGGDPGEAWWYHKVSEYFIFVSLMEDSISIIHSYGYLTVVATIDLPRKVLKNACSI